MLKSIAVACVTVYIQSIGSIHFGINTALYKELQPLLKLVVI